MFRRVDIPVQALNLYFNGEDEHNTRVIADISNDSTFSSDTPNRVTS